MRGFSFGQRTAELPGSPLLLPLRYLPEQRTNTRREELPTFSSWLTERERGKVRARRPQVEARLIFGGSECLSRESLRTPTRRKDSPPLQAIAPSSPEEQEEGRGILQRELLISFFFSTCLPPSRSFINPGGQFLSFFFLTRQ